MLEKISSDIKAVLDEFLPLAKLKEGSVLVLGFSTSEAGGGLIGQHSSLEVADAVYSVLYTELKNKGVYLAAQCCEHLNRALIVEAELARKLNLEVVNAVPQLHAGGASAVTAYSTFENPVVVEHIRADAGIDIGGTLIGMHLKEVAVPVHTSQKAVGSATVLCARVRPKFIGGERAVYNNDLL